MAKAYGSRTHTLGWVWLHYGLIRFLVEFREPFLFRHTLYELVRNYPHILSRLSFFVIAFVLGAALLASCTYAIPACRYLSLAGLVVSLGCAGNATVVALFFNPGVIQLQYFRSWYAFHSLLLWILMASAFYRSYRLSVSEDGLQATPCAFRSRSQRRTVA